MRQTESIDETVDEIVAESLAVTKRSFDDDSNLEAEPLAIESIDVLDIAQALDAELDVHASANDLESLDTVGDLKDFVDAKYDGK
ncbi:acyl carrier protein [Haloarculaceae archaeon H-GB2-1]|nr:acyl carrier protein [Haloarculaceae archaeon H-GB1-1]MEA5388355.1 acyl carrier protein [Haloarculaceae archaeon H-GB11]MEA5406393.1 acyl carrier protein [Haloarculaceae archaeon H-GB2-1]